MWFLRINMTDRTYKLEDVPAAYKHLGGRGLTSTIVADEVPPLAHPLGPNNKLVFAPGIVTGTSAPTSARVSVGGKSPLTGGIKEANAGTSWAPHAGRHAHQGAGRRGPAQGEGQVLGRPSDLGCRGRQAQGRVLRRDGVRRQGPVRGLPQAVHALWRQGARSPASAWPASIGYGNSGIVFNDMAQAPQPLCRPRRPGRGDGQQGAEVHRRGRQGRAGR